MMKKTIKFQLSVCFLIILFWAVTSLSRAADQPSETPPIPSFSSAMPKPEPPTTAKEKEKEKKEEKRTRVTGKLSEEEIHQIKEHALKQRGAIEDENIPSGVIRGLYVDPESVFPVYTSLNYVTVLRFPGKVNLSDVVIGAERYTIEIHEVADALLIFPILPFKSTNLTIFFKENYYHFLLVEKAQGEVCDYRVDVRISPEGPPSVRELLFLAMKGYVPESAQIRGLTFVKPICSTGPCKNVSAILEMKNPYMRVFKVKKAGGLRPVGASYEAETDEFFYIFYPSQRGRVVFGGVEHEIY